MGKISLKNVKNALKRDEMMEISAGCGSSYQGGACSYRCSSYIPGMVSASPVGSCYGSGGTRTVMAVRLWNGNVIYCSQ